MIVNIIHLIRLATVSCGRVFLGFFQRVDGLTGLTSERLERTETRKPSRPVPVRPTPKKTGSGALFPPPHHSKISKTKGHGVLSVITHIVKTVKGLKLFQIIKKGCSIFALGDFPKRTLELMAYGRKRVLRTKSGVFGEKRDKSGTGLVRVLVKMIEYGQFSVSFQNWHFLKMYNNGCL